MCTGAIQCMANFSNQTQVFNLFSKPKKVQNNLTTFESKQSWSNHYLHFKEPDNNLWKSSNVHWCNSMYGKFLQSNSCAVGIGITWNHDHKLSNKFHNFAFQSKIFWRNSTSVWHTVISHKNSSKMSKYLMKCLIFLPFFWLLSNNISTDVKQLTDWRDKEEL